MQLFYRASVFHHRSCLGGVDCPLVDSAYAAFVGVVYLAVPPAGHRTLEGLERPECLVHMRESLAVDEVKVHTSPQTDVCRTIATFIRDIS